MSRLGRSMWRALAVAWCLTASALAFAAQGSSVSAAPGDSASSVTLGAEGEWPLSRAFLWLEDPTTQLALEQVLQPANQARFKPVAASGAGSNFGLQRLGVGMRLPIFHGGRIRANIAANQANLDGLAVEYEKAILTALEDVENAYVAQQAFVAQHQHLAASRRERLGRDQPTEQPGTRTTARLHRGEDVTGTGEVEQLSDPARLAQVLRRTHEPERIGRPATSAA